MSKSALVFLVGLLSLPCTQAAMESHKNPLHLPDHAPTTGYRLERAFGDFTAVNPVAMATPPGETNRLFVVEQQGRISVITNLAQPNRTLFLDISDHVVFGGEQGLLGMAFHPGYATNRLFYVFYTVNTETAQGRGLHDRLARFQTDADNPNHASPDSEAPMITQRDRASNHNGGDLHFGPDGYLYVILGDEGAGNDSFHNSQLIDKNFFAGLLRIDVDCRPGNLPPNPHPAVNPIYAIPSDNPFVGATQFNGEPVDPTKVRTEFWAVGLRNAWRISFDSKTGILYAGDVGQDLREEVDIIVKGGNYGWNFMEANLQGPRKAPPGWKGIPPIVEYTHGGAIEQGFCVTGGVVYRGSRYPQLAGQYVFADYVTGNIWMLKYEGQPSVPYQYIGHNLGISAFGIDPSNGDVLLAAHQENTIKRLVPDPGRDEVVLPPTLTATGAFTDLKNLTVAEGIMPYEVNVPFWSDGALKRRWFMPANTEKKIIFRSTGNWALPAGMTWIKHFDLETTPGDSTTARKLETRFLVRTKEGVYGITYKWNDEGTEAFLVPQQGLDEPRLIKTGGIQNTQVWHYPSRSECLTCHTPQGGFGLGFNTAQLNRDVTRDGQPINQITWIQNAECFSNNVPDTAGLQALVAATQPQTDLWPRVHSYLTANCSYCHLPGGSAPGLWDARIETPLERAGIINGQLNDSLGDPDYRVVVPGVPEKSMILTRISKRGAKQMPPIASHVVDQKSVEMVREWILSLGKETKDK